MAELPPSRTDFIPSSYVLAGLSDTDADPSGIHIIHLPVNDREMY